MQADYEKELCFFVGGNGNKTGVERAGGCTKAWLAAQNGNPSALSGKNQKTFRYVNKTNLNNFTKIIFSTYTKCPQLEKTTYRGTCFFGLFKCLRKTKIIFRFFSFLPGKTFLFCN